MVQVEWRLDDGLGGVIVEHVSHYRDGPDEIHT
jgi:hypothetical protein